MAIFSKKHTHNSPPSVFIDHTQQPSDSTKTDYPATQLIKVLIQYIGQDLCSFQHYSDVSLNILKTSQTIYHGVNQLIDEVTNLDMSDADAWGKYETYSGSIDPLEEFLFNFSLLTERHTMLYKQLEEFAGIEECMTLIETFKAQRTELWNHVKEIKSSATYVNVVGSSAWTPREEHCCQIVCRYGDVSFLSLFLERIKVHLGKLSSESGAIVAKCHSELTIIYEILRREFAHDRISEEFHFAAITSAITIYSTLRMWLRSKEYPEWSEERCKTVWQSMVSYLQVFVQQLNTGKLDYEHLTTVYITVYRTLGLPHKAPSPPKLVTSSSKPTQLLTPPLTTTEVLSATASSKGTVHDHHEKVAHSHASTPSEELPNSPASGKGIGRSFSLRDKMHSIHGKIHNHDEKEHSHSSSSSTAVTSGSDAQSTVVGSGQSVHAELEESVSKDVVTVGGSGQIVGELEKSAAKVALAVGASGQVVGELEQSASKSTSVVEGVAGAGHVVGELEQSSSRSASVAVGVAGSGQVVREVEASAKGVSVVGAVAGSGQVVREVEASSKGASVVGAVAGSGQAVREVEASSKGVSVVGAVAGSGQAIREVEQSSSTNGSAVAGSGQVAHEVEHSLAKGVAAVGVVAGAVEIARKIEESSSKNGSAIVGVEGSGNVAHEHEHSSSKDREGYSLGLRGLFTSRSHHSHKPPARMPSVTFRQLFSQVGFIRRPYQNQAIVLVSICNALWRAYVLAETVTDEWFTVIDVAFKETFIVLKQAASAVRDVKSFSFNEDMEEVKKTRAMFAIAVEKIKICFFTFKLTEELWATYILKITEAEKYDKARIVELKGFLAKPGHEVNPEPVVEELIEVTVAVYHKGKSLKQKKMFVKPNVRLFAVMWEINQEFRADHTINCEDSCNSKFVDEKDNVLSMFTLLSSLSVESKKCFLKLTFGRA